MEKKKGAPLLPLVLGVAALLFLALLELNKNALWTWPLSLLLFLCYGLLRRGPLKGKPFFLRLAAFAGFAVLLGMLVRFGPGPYRMRPAAEGAKGKTDVVHIAQGDLTGVYTADGAVEVYAGIPYAKPPIGPLRWREPADPEPWDGVLAADHFAPMSMQPRNSELYNSLAQIIGYHDYVFRLDDNVRDPVSEDSLYLNIWKPAGQQEKLPVLVYIHGGALQTGQPWYEDYRGEGLAREGVLVVNMGYRLGVFGFLADEELAEESPNGTTGNYGLLDQIQALKWVRDNIEAFGGDPENVTIAGESAGSACVSALCTSPLAKGLFRRAIGESSTVTAPEPAHSFRLLDTALETGARTKARFGAQTIEELRQVDAKTLAAAADINHHITIDGYVLRETPYESYRKGQFNEEALLHGFNAGEGTPFILFDMANSKNYESKVRGYFGDYADAVLALYPASTTKEARDNWIDIYSGIYFTYGHYCWSRQTADRIPVYEYFFTKENGRLGPWHSGEEVYCYGNIPTDSPLYDEGDRELSRIMLQYWKNFIVSGDPNGEGVPQWERSDGGENLMELGESPRMVRDPFLDLYSIFDRMSGFDFA